MLVSLNTLPVQILALFRVLHTHLPPGFETNYIKTNKQTKKMCRSR